MTRGAVLFATAALAYATVEIWFAEMLRWAIAPSDFVESGQTFLAVLLLSYFGIAAFAGAVASRFVAGMERAAVIALTALVAFNLLVHLHLAIVPVFLLSLILLLAQVVRPLAIVESPWGVSLMLLGPDWVSNAWLMRWSILQRSVVFGVAVAFFAVLALVLVRMSPRLQGIVIGATIVTAFALRTPLRAEMPQTSASPHPGAMNVLLITLDTVRADHFSLYGYARRTTPELENIATRAVVYRHAIAPSNMTLSTHASLFTGLFPSQHGAHLTESAGPAYRLRDDVPTIGEIFRRRGYDVSAIAANTVYLSTAYGIDRGFTYYFNAPRARASASLDTAFVRNSHLLRYQVWQFWRSRIASVSLELPCRRADEITDRALERVDLATKRHRPFFLFVNYFDAHDPYRPPAPYMTMFLPAGTPSRGDREMAAYDGGIAYLDAEIARFLRGLTSRGVLDRTLIVITSDHGEAFGEHGNHGHGTSAYDEQVRVPLLILAPGRAPASITQPVSLTDVFHLLVNDDFGRSAVISEAFPITPVPRNWGYQHAGRAYIDGDLKLIRGVARPDELYDTRADPGEQVNLADVRSRDLQRLSADLDAWIAQHPMFTTGRRRPQLSKEAIERLRALGYLR